MADINDVQAPKFGQIRCMVPKADQSACTNGAYYIAGPGLYACGVHTKSKVQLVKLTAQEKNTQKDAMQAERDASTQAAHMANKAAGRRGSVRMLHYKGFACTVQHTPGYQAVFPNNKHGNRSDGIGMAELSPMRLGPVQHGQPGLPDAKNVENFHQQMKQFPGETDAQFEANRLAGFEDDEPHRHKVKKVKPLHSVWINRDEQVYYLDAIQARQLYCNFYERLALQEEEWERLLALVDDGCNVELIGYDAVAIDNDDFDAAYLSKDASFGHERVLYTMLIERDASKWPWRKYQTFAF